MKTLEGLIYYLSKLPGLGKKSATRIAYHLLQGDEHYNRQLAHHIERLQETVIRCSSCGNFTETDPCNICTSAGRDRRIICVVEQPVEIPVLEATREFNGLYHVLNGVISPINGVGPEDLTIGKLVSRVQDLQAEELIIATNPTVEGDTTALYISRIFSNDNLKISRLALGLPVGGDLEYADRLTLTRSLRDRTRL